MTKPSNRSERSLVYSPPGTKLYAVGFMMEIRGLWGHTNRSGVKEGREMSDREQFYSEFTTGYEVVRCGVYDGA